MSEFWTLFLVPFIVFIHVCKSEHVCMCVSLPRNWTTGIIFSRHIMGCRRLIRSALNNKPAEDSVLTCLLKTSGLRRRECYWSQLEETSILGGLKIIYWDSFSFMADSDSMALAVQGWNSLEVFTAGVHLCLPECTNKYILNQLFKLHSVMTSSSRLALRRYAVPPGAW